MKLKFTGKKITGLALVVPENERKFVDDMALFNFSPAKSMRLMKVMGYDRHRIVEDGVCASDLVEYGMRLLMADGKLKADEIDALVYMTAVDRQVKNPWDKPTIGLVLCRKGNQTVIEYALNTTNMPMGVGKYELTKSAPPDIAEMNDSLARLPPVVDATLSASQSIPENSKV